MFSVVTWLMLTISGLQNWSWKSQEVKIVKESEKRKWHHRRHCEGFSSRSFKNRTFSDLQYSQDPKTVPKMLYKHGRYSTTHWPVDSLLSANSWLLYSHLYHHPPVRHRDHTPNNGTFKLAIDTKRVFVSGGIIFISTDWLTATSARR